jgi:hypothetical protein
MSRRRVPERYSLSYGNSIVLIASQAVTLNIMARRRARDWDMCRVEPAHIERIGGRGEADLIMRESRHVTSCFEILPRADRRHTLPWIIRSSCGG